MPPKGRPTSSHSSRPTSHSSHSHSSHSHSSHSSHSSGFHHSPSHHHHSHYGAPPPPPYYGGSSYRPTHHRSYSYGGGRSLIGSCISVLSIVALIAFIAVIVVLNKNKWGNSNNNQNQNQQHAIGMQSESHDSIYVAPLERDVPWNSEYDSYYDKQTDCYFFLNTELDPPIWQYWYEGVSSDYGDYGWMEWDAREKRWYIQTGENKWGPLPEDKYRTYFWHFD